MWIAGAIAHSDEIEDLEERGAKVFPGVKAAVEDLKSAIATDLQLPILEVTR